MNKKILINIFSNFSGLTAQIVIAFFLAPFLVHQLGDAKYGVWTILAALSGYMSLLDFGIAAAVTKYVAEYLSRNDVDKINEVLNSTLLFFIVISSIFFITAVFISYFGASYINVSVIGIDVLKLLIIIVSFDVSVFVISGVYRGALGGAQKFNVINLARILTMLFKSLAFYLFLISGFDLVAMALISVSANIMLLYGYHYWLKKNYRFIEFNYCYVNKSTIKKIYTYSKYIFLSMLAVQLLAYSSTLIIGIFIGAVAVTYFSIPWTLSEYSNRIYLAISHTFTPAFSELDTCENKDNMINLLISGTKVTLFFSNMITFGVIIFGYEFISLWMGEKYADEARYLLVIFFVAQYFIAPQLVGGALLQGVSKHQLLSKLTFITAVSTIGVTIFMVIKFGILGAALGVAVPQLLLFGVFVPIYVCNYLNISIIEYVKKTHLMFLVPNILFVLFMILLKNSVYPSTFLLLFGEALLSSFIFMVAVYFFTLDSNEKKKLHLYLNSYKKNIL